MLLAILFVLMVAIWLTLRSRIAEVESRLRQTERSDMDVRIRELTRRVFQLELDRAASMRGPTSTKAEEHGNQQSAGPQPSPEEVLIEASPKMPAPATVVEVPRTQESGVGSVTSPPFQSSPASPAWFGRFRQFAGNEEWEGLFAGNILNKIGALVLVIGIALFLGYSFTRMSAAGRASIAAIISLALLGTGIFMERRQKYRIFSGGLIGAGWAAAYITAYAMYALPAAQVITSPFAGSLLLLAVAAGMIAHSLRYQFQAITSVAYFTAFGAGCHPVNAIRGS